MRGFQGADLAAPDALAAVAKHFCGYGAVTGGRDYASVDISERTLREVYLPPFAAAVASGVAAVMPAFTDLAGIPMTANAALLNGWLRERLEFDGVIVSDYHAIAELIRHGVAADLAHASALALKAGVDIDMMSEAYRFGLPVALERGWVAIGDIRRIGASRIDAQAQARIIQGSVSPRAVPQTAQMLASRRRLARAVAARAVVMLKNHQNVFPLAGRKQRLAVLGPLADASAEMRGPWSAAAAPDGPAERGRGPARDAVRGAGAACARRRYRW